MGIVISTFIAQQTAGVLYAASAKGEGPQHAIDYTTPEHFRSQKRR
ncbi:hypothetical protein KCP73_15140 [Salmonella enterica subsp. enterica]|nr:hypothetical protein KCP73_15140 [Salmonella enterica subsp. enterica]